MGKLGGDCREEEERRACLLYFLFLFELSWPAIGLNKELSVSFISNSGMPTFGKSSAVLIDHYLVPWLCSEKKNFFLRTNLPYFKGNNLERLPLA